MFKKNNYNYPNNIVINLFKKYIISLKLNKYINIRWSILISFYTTIIHKKSTRLLLKNIFNKLKYR
jgi:hypothetical protein